MGWPCPWKPKACGANPIKRCLTNEPKYEVPNVIFSKIWITISGNTAQRNVARRAQPGNQQQPAVDRRMPERNRDQTVEQHQPVLKHRDVGPRRRRTHTVEDQQVCALSTMISCTQTTIAKLIIGRTASGMIAFESTVVRSETGNDFQKRMLRSRRSPCSASRQ